MKAIYTLGTLTFLHLFALQLHGGAVGKDSTFVQEGPRFKSRQAQDLGVVRIQSGLYEMKCQCKANIQSWCINHCK